MKLFFVSLGCDKNLVDSEKMLSLLAKDGYSITEDAGDAEIIIINTCAFILDAKQESIETILEMAEYKKYGKCRSLIVAGCLAERYQEELLKEMPEVDGIVGTAAYDQIAIAVQESLNQKQAEPGVAEQTDRLAEIQGDSCQKQAEPGVAEQTDRLAEKQGDACRKKPILAGRPDYLPKRLTDRIRASMPHTAHLKIAEGCDKHCTYCIIPKLRGPFRSVPMEELLEEAEKLAESGAKELILVAQETTLYGVDLYGEKRLPELLRHLCRIDGIEWIRLMYCYPEEITEELLLAIKEEDKICHYLDLPIQHCNDTVLRKMGRKTTRKELEDRIAGIRKIIPDIALRTTLIAGFPGETQEQHEECVNFVAEMKFDRLGVFPYSAEEDTPAAGFGGQVSEECKKERADRIMETEQAVIFEKNRSMAGCQTTDRTLREPSLCSTTDRTLRGPIRVMIDGYLPDDDVYVGRSYRDAPEIDGCVFVRAPYGMVSGEVVEVQITGAQGYDLTGEICN